MSANIPSKDCNGMSGQNDLREQYESPCDSPQAQAASRNGLSDRNNSGEQVHLVTSGSLSTLATDNAQVQERPKPTLRTLLPDIHLKIFCFLDVCTSTCLGLTCKILWSIHSAQHRKTSLFAKIRLPWPNPHLSDSFLNVYLFQLLAGWFDAVLWKKYFMKWSSVAIDLEHAEWVMADQKQSAKEKAKVRGKADLAWFQQTKRQPMLPGLLGDGAHSFG